MFKRENAARCPPINAPRSICGSFWLSFGCHFEPKEGERSVAKRKGVGVVDGSLEEVAASVMEHCSNERMRVSREKGNPARLELRKKATENEMTFATVK